MTKDRDRPHKEQKKPKSDKNKKPKHQPFGGKQPATVISEMHSVTDKKQQ
jgi:hypothetical protein